MCAKKLEELFLEAGFPEGVYQNLFISSRDTEYVLAKNEIK
jgi:acyl-CoA reductase-like NAD-dependent aldehyde dehydrogenase